MTYAHMLSNIWKPTIDRRYESENKERILIQKENMSYMYLMLQIHNII